MNDLADQSARFSKIPQNWLNYIKEPKAIVKVNFPVEMRNGEIQTIRGIRIVHSNQHLPTKGGLRFSVDTPEEDLEGLAALMSYKASLHNIPFGGAKGCVFIDPQKFTYEEKVRTVRRFTVELWKRSMISASTDVMGPDLGTDEKMMNIIKDTYKNVISHSSCEVDAVVTGKGVAFGGLAETKKAAGYGVARAAKFIMEHMDENKLLKKTGLAAGGSKKSFIIQGFGENAYQLSKILCQGDFKLVGITEGEHGCFNVFGFNPDEIKEYKHKNGTLQGISKTLNKPEDILGQRCDIIFAATKELSVTKEIAENMKCKLVIEASNAPLTREAMDILRNREIPVVPDVLSYAGGFIISYLEWLKNLEHRNLTLLFKRFESNSRKQMLKMLATSDIGVSKDVYAGPEEKDLIFSTIEEIQDQSFKDVLNVAEEYDTDLRTAALKIAIERIYNQYKTIGGISI